MRKLMIPALIAAGLATSSAVAAADALGTWRTSDGDVTVRVGACGAKLCGRIIAMQKPLDKKGKPKVDRHNPNAGLRNRPLIGLTVLTGMTPSGANKWKGTIYNADDGRTYSAYMTLAGNTMSVKGCVAIFCSTKTFVRIN